MRFVIQPFLSSLLIFCVSGGVLAKSSGVNSQTEDISAYWAGHLKPQKANECMLGFEYLSKNPLEGAPANVSASMGGLGWIGGGAADILAKQSGAVEEMREGELYKFRKAGGGDLSAIPKERALAVYMECTDLMLLPEHQAGLKDILDIAGED